MTTDDSSSALAGSFTDMMTSLLVIFILLFVAFINNDRKKGESTRDSILAELIDQLKDFKKDNGIEIRSDPKDPLALIVIVPEAALNFEKNQFAISKKGKEFLRDFIPRLCNVTCSEKFNEKISSIVIEGHTDAIGGEIVNLPLSQNRSLSVVQEGLDILKSEGDSNKSCFLNLLSTNGRADADCPTKIGEDPLCRNVQFKIRAKSLEQQTTKYLLTGN